MKIHILKDCIAQHTILNIGKSLLLLIGYTDSYYSAFGREYLEGLSNNKRITEDLVLNDKKAPYDSPKRWIKYRYFKVCTLPFTIKYKWKETDTIFKIHPELWIRLNRVN